MSASDLLCPSLVFRYAMYIDTGESKTVPFSGLFKSRYPLAISCTTSRVDDALAMEVYRSR
jgi:hypothetical protein